MALELLENVQSRSVLDEDSAAVANMPERASEVPASELVDSYYKTSYHRSYIQKTEHSRQRRGIPWGKQYLNLAKACGMRRGNHTVHPI